MDQPRLIIGNYNYSSWSMRPWLFIRHHDLPIEITRLALFSEEFYKELGKHLSNSKVPLLIDDNLEVWDTIAILEYLAEKYPQTRGWPQDSQVCAVARSVCAEMHASFSAMRNEMPMNCRRYFPGYQISADANKDINRIQLIWNHCRQNYGSAGPWLFGRFSIADAMYAPVVMRFRSFDVELDNVSQAYCDTMNTSAAVIEWVENGRMEHETVSEDEIDWPGEDI